MKTSPLAPDELTELPALPGVRFASLAAGVRYTNRPDLMLMHFEPGSVMAGVFTQSATRSAPVLHSQAILGFEGSNGIAILVNSGNSNAFTGAAGDQACQNCVHAIAQAMNLKTQAVHMASTGVIGEVLPDEKITCQVDKLVANLSSDGALGAAQAILTTDTFAKGAQTEVDLGAPIRIIGIAKGSGMIAPDMATMLGFLATDAAISQPLLQTALRETSEKSFNAITVDSDTSTSDSVYLGATGQTQMEPITRGDDPRFAKFVAALQKVMTNLAHQIVRDGEGASKFIEIKVTGATDSQNAKTIAMAIANSPLVKTAIAGEDPNWGRIIMAIGKSGAIADRDKIRIQFGQIRITENGGVHPDYHEADAAKYMKNQELQIRVDMGLGDGEFIAWTCDLTHQYIEINADYRS